MENIFKPDTLFARPSSVEEVYPSVACNATVLVVPEKDVAEYRKVVDTLYMKPVLLAESSATKLAGADGVICGGKCVLKERLGVEQSTNSTLQLTATLTETTLTINDGTRGTTLALAEINSEKCSIDHLHFPPIVKICGLTTVEAATAAIEAGANMLGMIMVPGRSRTVSAEVGLQISELVHRARGSTRNTNPVPNTPTTNTTSTFDVSSFPARTPGSGPFLVGVFRNQPLSEILSQQARFNLDYVQLHGDEPVEWAREIPVPVIKRFTPGTEMFKECLHVGCHAVSLVDGALGGEGQVVDRSELGGYARRGGRFVVAGGLDAENVGAVFLTEGVIGVDVSGGVETNGKKDVAKIRAFVENANAGWRKVMGVPN